VSRNFPMQPDTRRKQLQNKLKIGWQICNVADYLVAMRCFNCSSFNHRHKDCKGEETCPLCVGGHKLRECVCVCVGVCVWCVGVCVTGWVCGGVCLCGCVCDWVGGWVCLCAFLM